MTRIDGRKNNELRPIKIVPGYISFAEGSALIEMGLTRVLCTASIEEQVPTFLRGHGKGWVTAEYGMLPRATLIRTPRVTTSDRPKGRTFEIQRLIGRSLRAVTDLQALGERTVILDCDVIQADGGTRTASITGAYVALYQALQGLVRNRVLSQIPLRSAVAAVSVGVVEEELLLDLCYQEDSRAQVDFNVVATDKREFVEVQGAAEGSPFSRETMLRLLSLAEEGIAQIFQVQREAIRSL